MKYCGECAYRSTAQIRDRCMVHGMVVTARSKKCRQGVPIKKKPMNKKGATNNVRAT
jgi:hypothetical protein